MQRFCYANCGRNNIKSQMMREMQASSQVVPRDQFSKVKWTGAIVQVLLASRLELRNNSSCAGQRRLSMASGRSLVSIPRSAYL